MPIEIFGLLEKGWRDAERHAGGDRSLGRPETYDAFNDKAVLKEIGGDASMAADSPLPFDPSS